MALTDIACRTAKPADRLQKLSDAGGLQLWVQPGGAKLWRYAYRFGGKQKLLALGSYPLVTLANARMSRDAAKRLLIDGIDPAEARREQRVQQASSEQTFRLIAGEYLGKLKAEGRTPKTIEKVGWLLSFAYPVVGDRPIASIKAADVLQVLRKLEARGRNHSAHRLKSTISAVFRLAIATARAEADPTVALQGALVAYKEEPRPALTTEKSFGALLRTIDSYEGQPVTRIVLQLMALLFPRPGELRQARWEEFDLDEARWSVPASRMKGRKEHFVPLSRQALALFKDLQAIVGDGHWVFPAVGNPRRCLSDGTMNSALRRMGVNTEAEHCAHGFRSSASTLLNESGKFHHDAIERQLAHVDKDAVRGIYARGTYWDERVTMMQWWADYCDQLKAAERIVKLVK